jgi:hypothetical protein
LIGLAGYEALHHHIRPLLVIAVIPAVLSALLVAAVREWPRPRDQATPASGGGPLPSQFWRVLTVILIFSVANFRTACHRNASMALGCAVSPSATSGSASLAMGDGCGRC